MTKYIKKVKLNNGSFSHGRTDMLIDCTGDIEDAFSYNNFKKLKVNKITLGMRLNWYYEKDKKALFKDGVIDPHNVTIYSGIVVPKLNIDSVGIIDSIIVIDFVDGGLCKPPFKWITIPKLLDEDNLVEVYTNDK